ncbi:unnamed protein product [Protopolystoma xenopodis]|uniref:Uncharacterized protein n=1 Tax=Protopolystoma xenopodis TaxID=117903 RepID=A0A448WYW9_9PLAT|nr:unnamed protein product [Protopolystoma xenopodis]
MRYFPNIYYFFLTYLLLQPSDTQDDNIHEFSDFPALGLSYRRGLRQSLFPDASTPTSAIANDLEGPSWLKLLALNLRLSDQPPTESPKCCNFFSSRRDPMMANAQMSCLCQFPMLPIPYWQSGLAQLLAARMRVSLYSPAGGDADSLSDRVRQLGGLQVVQVVLGELDDLLTTVLLTGLSGESNHGPSSTEEVQAGASSFRFGGLCRISVNLRDMLTSGQRILDAFSASGFCCCLSLPMHENSKKDQETESVSMGFFPIK